MDSEILHSIHQATANPFFDAVFPYLTMLGEAGAVWIVIGVCLLVSRQYRFWGIVMLATLAFVGLFDELLIKHIVARPRPFVADPSIQLIVSPPSGYSFPSGHTTTSIASAVIISLMPIKNGWKAGAWVLAITLAFTRLYLFVHYPSDVLVGALLGVIYGYLAVKIGFALQRRRQSKQEA